MRLQDRPRSAPAARCASRISSRPRARCARSRRPGSIRRTAASSIRPRPTTPARRTARSPSWCWPSSRPTTTSSPWMKRALECCADHGGTPEASGADAHREGAAGVWRNAFIRMPYAMERLILRGVINDTFETAITWDRFEAFHDAIKAATENAIREATGRSGQVTCRFTHVYPDGPAPYFTFHALGEPGKLGAQWHAIKSAAIDAVIAQRRHDHAPSRGRPRSSPVVRPAAPAALRRRAARRQEGARSAGPAQSRRADRSRMIPKSANRFSERSCGDENDLHRRTSPIAARRRLAEPRRAQGRDRHSPAALHRHEVGREALARGSPIRPEGLLALSRPRGRPRRSARAGSAARLARAALASWKGVTDINSRSIGIEIVNPGHEFGYRDFPDVQIEAVIALCRDILARHPIPRERVLGALRYRAGAQAGPRREISLGAPRRRRHRLLGRADADRRRTGRSRRTIAAPRWRTCRDSSLASATAADVTRFYDKTTARSSRRSSGISAPSASMVSRMPRRATRCAAVNGRLVARLIESRAAKRSTPIASVGRTAAWGQCRKAALRGKSGLHGHTVPDNVRREKPRASAANPGKVPQKANRPTPARVTARVKRCGKSAPRFRRRKRHGKPHREQDRIGTARRRKRRPGPVSGSGRPGRLLEAPGNRRPRGMAVTRRVRPPPYRTRLTGRLIC